MKIVKLNRIDKQALADLSASLITCVIEGASIGFLNDINEQEAEHYWLTRQHQLGENLHLWVAVVDDELVGSIQLERCNKRNGFARGEIQKLFVVPAARGKGIASALLKQAEGYAFANAITTLVLDTETGSDAEKLYSSRGWHKVGEIPNYALTPMGKAISTSIFYKRV